MTIEQLLAFNLVVLGLATTVWLAIGLAHVGRFLLAWASRRQILSVPAEWVVTASLVFGFAVIVYLYGDIERALAIVKWLSLGIALAILLLIVGRLVFSLFPDYRKSTTERFPRFAAATRQVGTATFQVMIAAAAATTAVALYETYKANNGNAMWIALEERDRQIRTHYMREEGRNLMQVFSDQPEIDPGTCDPELVRKWAVDYVSSTTGLVGKWSNIADLDRLLWSTDSMKNNTPSYQLARAIMMHAVDYLYIIHDAYHSHMKGYFSSAERDMWSAYIDDLGDSPFFLWALKDGERYGYMMPDVRAEMLAYFRVSEHRRCIARALYPELLTEKP